MLRNQRFFISSLMFAPMPLSAIMMGLVTCLPQVPAATITDMSASQRDGTGLVDLAYTLTAGTTCSVSLAFSTNNGVTYDRLAVTMSGTGTGAGVTPGPGKSIVWDADRDWSGNYSTQVWFQLKVLEGALSFAETTNIAMDELQGTTWSQPVNDGTNIVASCETGFAITARKYDYRLNPVDGYAIIATTNDTGGERIADHKHIFQNGHHFLVFSIAADGDGGSLYLVKFDRSFNRLGIVTVVSNTPPTNDMLLFGDGEHVYVGKFYPEGGAAHKIYKYDEGLNWVTNYLEGVGENSHANGDAALYHDGRFYFVSPQYVGPGANDRYYMVAYDRDFNVVSPRTVILQEDTKLGLINGLSWYHDRFIIHYCRGSNEANPIGRAVFNSSWALEQNATVITGGLHAPHSVIISNTLVLGYTRETPSFRGMLAAFTIAGTSTAGVGQVGPVTIDTGGQEPPEMPRNVTASEGLFPDRIMVHWSTAAYASSYEVWRHTLADTNAANLLAASLNGTNYPDMDTAPRKTYFYWVKARNAAGVSSMSDGDSGWCRGAVLNDFSGNGRSCLAVFDTAAGAWYIAAANGTLVAWNMPWGWPGAWPVSGDYDADGRSDLAVFDANTGNWYVSSLNGVVLAWAIPWGWPGAWPVSGDYDADGRSDLAVFDSNTGNWYVSSLNGTVLAWAVPWGWPGARPVSGDYDADGRSDLAVFDSGTGNWYVSSLHGSVLAWAVPWGWPGAIPVAGDYNRDGCNDLAVFDSITGNWYVYSPNGAVLAWAIPWGWPGAWPVSGDYDADGRSDLAVFDANTGNWYVRSVAGDVLVWAQPWGWPGAWPVGGVTW